MKMSKRDLVRFLKGATLWGDTRVWPGARALLGILSIIGGLFGFLPILGFWMLPLGVVLIGLDIPPLRRRLPRWSRSDGLEP